MRSGLVAAVIALVPVASAPSQSKAPSPEAQAAIIEDVRNYALNYSRTLPDYICTQITRRYVMAARSGPLDGGGVPAWKQTDTLTIRLTYFGQREHYVLEMVNKVPTKLRLNDLSGTISMGDFGTIMREIFEPVTQAHFVWDREARLRGRVVDVFSYEVPLERSQWRLGYESDVVVTPYHGILSVDQETHQVLRIAQQAVDVPDRIALRRAETAVEYDYQVIGGQKALLPLKGEIILGDGRRLMKNENEFHDYHKYSADSAVTFDTGTETK
jgi:hypothetical protein